MGSTLVGDSERFSLNSQACDKQSLTQSLQQFPAISNPGYFSWILGYLDENPVIWNPPLCQAVVIESLTISNPIIILRYSKPWLYWILGYLKTRYFESTAIYLKHIYFESTAIS